MRQYQEIDIEIALEKQRYLDDMQFFAKSNGKTDPAVSMELIIHTAQQQAKRIGELYERRGELKLSKGISDIKNEIINRDLERTKQLYGIRAYLKKLSAWKRSKSTSNPPNPPKHSSKIRMAFADAWKEYCESVKGIRRATADDFFESQFFTDPIQDDGSCLATYIPTVEDIRTILHAIAQNKRNATMRNKSKATQKQKRLKK